MRLARGSRHHLAPDVGGVHARGRRSSDYRELLDFVEAEGLSTHVDPVQFSVRLLVPPGSLLLESPAMRPYLGALVAERLLLTAGPTPTPGWKRCMRTSSALVAGAADRREDAAVDLRSACASSRTEALARRRDLFRRRRPSQAAASADRTLVLLSGAHGGPVGPERKLG